MMIEVKGREVAQLMCAFEVEEDRCPSRIEYSRISSLFFLDDERVFP